MRAPAIVGPLVAACIVLPLRMVAQDTVVVTRPGGTRGSPAERRAIAVFNAPGTTRFIGPHTIGPSDAVRGDAASLDGPLRVEGTVRGDLVAINADVFIAAGAEVQGDVLVLGGRLDESAGATIRGSLERHATGPRVRWVGDRLELEGGGRPRERDHRLPRTSRTGRASIVLSTEGTYNRVEGLPVVFGPRLSWSDTDVEARFDGLGIFRTAAGLDLDDREVGYRALGRVRLGAQWSVELGIRAFDQVAPIEAWQLRRDEIGWASFLFHRDYADYFLERGLAGYGRVRLASGVTLFSEVAGTEARSVAARDPWTVLRNSDPWRANPTVDEGDFTEITAGVDLSTTGDPRWDGGARLRVEWLHGRGDDVTARALPVAVRAPLPADDYSYDRLFGDLRLHQPFVAGGLSLRAVAAGVVGDGPLPVQRRLSLGGPDPMPGYGFRRFACNEGVSDPALPALCDRLLLFQAEYRSGFDFSTIDDDDDDWDRHPWHDFDLDESHFVLFADAGTAWLRGDEPGRLRWDLGAGVRIGGFGIYAARALESREPVRVVLRLHHRF